MFDINKFIAGCLITCLLLLDAGRISAQSYTMEAVTGYPFPSELTAAATGSKIAMAMNERGLRNVYVAEGPAFLLRKVTRYTKDDGQEITSLSISSDGKWIVYVRGGEHSGNRDRSMTINPAFDPVLPKVEVWSLPFAGGKPILLAEGDYPVISPAGKTVAFIKDDQVWTAPLDGTQPAKILIGTRGMSHSIRWSPDGSKLAFVSNRSDHSFIGVYSNPRAPVTWLEPSFGRDVSPRWSPDGKNITFVRTPGLVINTAASGTEARQTAAVPAERGQNNRHQPWAIWTADVSTGKGTQLWKAPETMRGSIPGTDGATNLFWAAGNRITFLSYQDGWPHLYSMSATGGEPTLLTPGNFMVEQVKLTPDGKWLVFSINGGPDSMDIDRRHVARVPVDKAAMELLTPGTELETYPVITGDMRTVAMFSASARRPLLPAIKDLKNGNVKLLGEQLMPANFPVSKMIIPKQVIYYSPDGTKVHAQLFEPPGNASKKPAIVYCHGGPQRQMLLGWHHMDYYSIDYSLNQYLASLGFVVLSVNFRLGIGYGYDFHRPTIDGANYIDVKAGAMWLAAQPQVDSGRISIYGGSHGGALVAQALASDSKLFKAGVLIHGTFNDSIDRWKSPVMIIHADDDRNVNYSAGISLVNRLHAAKVPYEYLAIPDDTHHWMRYGNVLKVNKATADFLKKKMMQL